jgi:hypothetical protein
MKLVTALALVSLAVAAIMVVFSANFYGSDDPYFMWGVALLAVPPAAIGLLLLAPWRSLRITAGWLALFLGAWWVVSGGSTLVGGILALVTGSGQQDLVGTLLGGAVEGLLAALNLAIFWAAVLRDRGSRTSSHPSPLPRDT